MRRLHWFIDALRFSYTTRVFLPDGWQGVSCGRWQQGTSPTRWGARRWVMAEAWHQAGLDVYTERQLRWLGDREQ